MYDNVLPHEPLLMQQFGKHSTMEIYNLLILLILHHVFLICSKDDGTAESLLSFQGNSGSSSVLENYGTGGYAW
jgi:hypothetical protein